MAPEVSDRRRNLKMFSLHSLSKLRYIGRSPGLTVGQLGNFGLTSKSGEELSFTRTGILDYMAAEEVRGMPIGTEGM